MKLLGQRLMAPDFDPQVAEFQLRVAVLNGYTALGIPVTKVAAQVCPGEGALRPSADLCNRAPNWRKFSVAGQPLLSGPCSLAPALWPLLTARLRKGGLPLGRL